MLIQAVWIWVHNMIIHWMVVRLVHRIFILILMMICRLWIWLIMSGCNRIRISLLWIEVKGRHNLIYWVRRTPKHQMTKYSSYSNTSPPTYGYNTPSYPTSHATHTTHNPSSLLLLTLNFTNSVYHLTHSQSNSQLKLTNSCRVR